ncbi:Endoglucanase cel12A [Cytospora mali]|uniref:Endoglucanase cel12A n=1 Tax=Cytospora mali TaxID=578113 RepID=A0A194V115_CYTMA|nr:Endoglucanase cel12A [Valsa mali var. pyri (nom. inval.)]
MRPHTVTFTLTAALLAVPGATASKKGGSSTSSSSSSAATNGYDAVICGKNGYADGSGLSYSANAWNPDGDGFQCLSIINASSSTSSGFDATWHWPVDTESVHSYPHVTFSSGALPESLSNISALRLAADWAYSPGSISTANDPSRRVGLDASGLNDVGAIANIAFDMFMDPDEANATSATAAKFEMMIWIGQIGQPHPLGFDSENATCYTQQLGSFNFTLYTGQNSRGTSVFTWVSPTDQTSFNEDIAPLLQYLWRNELVSADARLGLIEFGSEAYHSGNNVTFSATDFSMDVWLGTPVKFELNPPADHCKEPESPAGPQGTSTPKKDLGVRPLGQPGGALMIVVLLGSMLAGLV